MANHHRFLDHKVGDSHVLQVVHVAATDAHGTDLTLVAWRRQLAAKKRTHNAKVSDQKMSAGIPISCVQQPSCTKNGRSWRKKVQTDEARSMSVAAHQQQQSSMGDTKRQLATQRHVVQTDETGPTNMAATNSTDLT